MKQKHLILGVDPGTRITGYGIIEAGVRTLTPIDYGCIRPSQKLSIYCRCAMIHEGVEHLLETHHITALSIESQFISKNPQSALKLGMAKSAVALAATKRDIPIYEYTPRKAKLAIVGFGNASKHQIQRMIQTLLQLKSIPNPEDVADALGLAICHAHQSKG